MGTDFATHVATEYFSRRNDPTTEHQVPVIVQTWSPERGWLNCQRPWNYLSSDAVETLHQSGVRAVQLAAHCRLADFAIQPGNGFEPTRLA